MNNKSKLVLLTLHIVGLKFRIMKSDTQDEPMNVLI